MRIFVALPVDPECARALGQQLKRRRLERFGVLRWVPAANYHLTLAFLGEQGEEVVPRVEACLGTISRQTSGFVLRLSRVVCFSVRHTPRLLAALPQPGSPLAALHFRLAGELRAAGLYELRRTYRPHVTLARLRHSRPLHCWEDQPLQLALPVNRLVLYQSVRATEGVRYQPLCQSLLRGEGQAPSSPERP